MLFTGFILGIGTTCGAFFLYNTWEERLPKSTVDISLLCSTRGGEWVHGSTRPLCMTKDAGLLEFANGSFVPYKEEGIAQKSEESTSEVDPWKVGFEAPLAERAVKYEVEERETDELPEENIPKEEAVTTEEKNEMCEEEEVKEQYEGRIASVNFSSWPEATKYRSAIEKDVARGVNFAGSYVVATWGCGTNRSSCVGHAVVDAQSGDILLYKERATRTGVFSVEKNALTINGEDGEETWNILGEKLVRCGN